MDLDNKCFEDESQDKVVALPSVGEENPNWKAYENTSWEDYAPGSYPNPTMRGPGQQNVNVFDYEVSSFDDDKPAQEMQEKGGPSLLSQSSTSQPQTSMDTSWDEVDDSSGVTSDAKQGA